MPPAILNAPSEIPNALKIRPPATAKMHSVTHVANAALPAIRRRASALCREVIVRKTGDIRERVDDEEHRRQREDGKLPGPRRSRRHYTGARP